jgi:urease accessory protein
MHAALLLLTDGRLPSGAHAHSGGLEQVAVDGRVRSVEDVGLFARGVLEGAGGTAEAWARQPSAAARRASEAQGRALLRTGRRVWPGTLLETLAAGSLRPPLPVVLGAVAAAAGLSPRDAALASLHGQVSGVASAAVRLLGLDPIEVAAALATLTPTLDRLAHDAAACATTDPGRLRLLPATTGPLLDVLAERHDAREMTLFAS